MEATTAGSASASCQRRAEVSSMGGAPRGGGCGMASWVRTFLARERIADARQCGSEKSGAARGKSGGGGAKKGVASGAGKEYGMPRFRWTLRGSSSVGRALRSQRRGRGFESLLLHQGFRRDGRGGVAKWPTASDCKSDLYEFDGSNPSPTTNPLNP